MIFSAESRAYDFWGMLKDGKMEKVFEGLDVGIERVGGLFGGPATLALSDG